MEQLSLTGPDLSGPLPVSVAGPEPSRKSGVTLRPYQAVRAGEAISMVLDGRSPMVEMATGTGKTAVGAEMMRALAMAGKRQLWIVHRIELVTQAKIAIEKATGLIVGLELPSKLSRESDRIVVASKDTIRSKARLERLKSGTGFDVIYTDEAHHSPGQSYQAIYETWPEAVRVGLTATVDRLDEQELSNFNARTTPYTIIDGICDGWLVPFIAKRVKVRSIDISSVGLVAGDFNQGQLEAVISAEKPLHGIAQGLFDNVGDRPTIVFVPGVDSGQRLAEIINRTRSGAARFVCGQTPDETRAGIFRDFGKRYQFLINVGVATEGTDLPAAACIAMARLTKSRVLFSQMLGRGGRTWPGIDSAPDDSGARRSWIRNSKKPDCLVLDFVGNVGKHSVVTVADVLAGADPVRFNLRSQGTVSAEIAASADAGETVDVLQALLRESEQDKAQQERREKVAEQRRQERLALVASVTLETKDAALIGLGGLHEDLEPSLALDAAATVGQVEMATALGVALPAGCDRRKARFLIGEARVRAGLATQPQLDLIRKHRPELVTATMTKADAQRIITVLIKKWKGGRYARRY